MKKKLLIMPVIFSAMSGITVVSASISCTNKLSGETFEITDDGILKGFNPKWSKEDIKTKLAGQTTLVIPSNVTRIDKDAFYQPNESYDITTYSTIPNFIKILDLSQATKLERICSGAFAAAPFEKIIFNHQNQYVESRAFAYNYNLNYIDLSDLDVFPVDSWAIDAWDSVHNTQGVIKIMNNISKIAWEKYFLTNTNFAFGQQKWVIDTDAYDKVYKFDENNAIAGLSDDFLTSNVREQKQKLFEISGYLETNDDESNTLYIPSYHNGCITQITEQAFYENINGKSLIPNFVEHLYFDQAIGYGMVIGKHAFNDAPFDSVTLSQYISNVEDEAFFDLKNLTFIDASSLWIPPQWDGEDIWSCTESGTRTEGKIRLKINSKKPNEIYTYFQNQGIEQSWEKDYLHKNLYDQTVDLVKGFDSDFTRAEIIEVLSENTETRGPLEYYRLQFDNDVIGIDDSAFYRDGKSTIPYGDSSLPTIVYLDNTKTEYIGDHAFATSKIYEIQFSDSLKTIEEFAFYNTALGSVVGIDENLESISRYAFAECKDLTSITLTKGLSQLSDHAFYNCKKLNEIDMTSFTKEDLSNIDHWSKNNVFNGISSEGKIIVSQDVSEDTSAVQVIQNYFDRASIGSMQFDAEHWKIETPKQIK